MIAADHGKDRRGLGVVAHHAVGHQGFVDRERVTPLSRDAGHGGVEPAGVVVPDRHAIAHRKARRILDGDLLFAEVAVEGQRGHGAWRLSQDGLSLDAANGDVGAQVQRIAHEVLARADLDEPASETCDVVDGRLKHAVVGADQIGVLSADRDAGRLVHRRVHGRRKLLLLGSRREIGCRFSRHQRHGCAQSDAEERDERDEFVSHRRSPCRRRRPCGEGSEA